MLESQQHLWRVIQSLYQLVTSIFSFNISAKHGKTWRLRRKYLLELILFRRSLSLQLQCLGCTWPPRECCLCQVKEMSLQHTQKNPNLNHKHTAPHSPKVILCVILRRTTWNSHQSNLKNCSASYNPPQTVLQWLKAANFTRWRKQCLQQPSLFVCWHRVETHATPTPPFFSPLFLTGLFLNSRDKWIKPDSQWEKRKCSSRQQIERMKMGYTLKDGRCLLRK